MVRLVNHMVRGKRFFAVPQPEAEGQTSKTSSTVLQEVCSITEYWERPFSEGTDREVEMKEVNFSVTNEVMGLLKQVIFKDDFFAFVDYFKHKLHSIIIRGDLSFDSVYRRLLQDTQGALHARNYLGLMQELVRT